MTPRAAILAALDAKKLSRDAGGLSVHPQGMEDARRVVELCVQNRWAWRPSGGGRRSCPQGEELSIAAPSGVFDLWADELVARVGAGTTFEQLDARLQSQGLRLGSEAPLPKLATLGGAFASADRGLASRVGRCLADRALGARFVDGGGRLLQAGARVVKNVAGYDLTRVHWGAAGSLGLVLDITLRLEARPESSRTLFFAGDLPQSLDRLAALRRKWAGDCVRELWVSAPIAKACGLPAAGLCIAREGFVADLDHWQTCCAGEHAVEQFESLRDFGWADVVLRASLGASRASQLRGDPSLPMICDVLAGETWVFTSEEFSTAALKLWIGANAAALVDRTWVERGSLPRITHASSSHLRLKSVFDPHGLLPPMPTPLDVEAMQR